MTDEKLPREVARGEMRIGTVTVPVVILDDGRRLVTEEGIRMFLDWLARGSPGQMGGGGEDDVS